MAKEKETNNRTSIVASVSSADGWNSLGVTFAERFKAGSQDMLLASLTINGKFWNRQRSMHSISEAELADDYFVCLPQTILSEARLNEFLNRLETWLNDFSEFEIDISGSTDQSLSVFIGQREDFISKPDRPVFSFKYNTSRMKGEWCFVTDYSCINLLLQELQNALAGV